MSCDRNCAACPIQCGASTLSKLEANKKESREMSEGAITCKSGNEEKIAVHSAWIDGVKKNTLLLLVFGAIIVGFIVYLNARITSIEIKNAVEIATIKTEIEIKISSLKNRLKA